MKKEHFNELHAMSQLDGVCSALLSFADKISFADENRVPEELADAMGALWKAVKSFREEVGYYIVCNFDKEEPNNERGRDRRMKEGLYEIVGMRRADHGKWIFTARPVNCEISFECESEDMEEEVFNHATGVLRLFWKETPEGNVLTNFVGRGKNEK